MVDQSLNNKGSDQSSSGEVSQDRGDETNFIKKCIQQHFDSESFAKFQQLLEYIDKKLYSNMFIEYNAKLRDSLRVAQNYLPPNYSVNHYIQVKVKYYSFYFIKNIGNYILDQLNNGSPKAEQSLLILTKILLFHGLTSRSDTANLALVELEQLCINQNMTFQTMYDKYRGKFLRLIIKAILFKLMNNSENESPNGNGILVGNHFSGFTNKNNPVITYMTRALEVFNIATITIEDVAQSLIITANLIHKEIYDDAIRRFLEYLANYQNIDIYTLIRGHIQTILVSLLLRGKLSHFDITASLNKLCSFCSKTPKELLATKFTFIKGRLILNYSIDAKKVSDGIYFLSKYEKEEHDQPFEEELDDEKSFIDYLSPSMIGILLGIDSHFTMTRREFGSEESIKQIESLYKLISLLTETQVQTIHVKLLSTLSLLISLRPRSDNIYLNKSIINLWTLFVSKLSKELRLSLLINICVVLNDLVEDCSEDVANIYENLICDNESPELKQLKSLFFIPNTGPMSKIYDYLTPYVKRDCLVSNFNELHSLLSAAEPLMEFENQKSKYIALTRFKEVLRKNQNFLISNMSMNRDEPLDKMISSIIQRLLTTSSTTDVDCSNLIAECLGIIGAINPVRLDHLIYGEIPERRPCIVNLSDSHFIALLIERLKNSLLSDQRNESETANYALQVVVKNFSVFKDKKIYSRLTPEAVKACQLCQNTSYSGNRKMKVDSSLTVYEKLISENNYCYNDWLDKFSLNLFSSIKDKKIQDVLNACSFVFRFNPKLAEFLLPPAVIHLLINPPHRAILVKAEIRSILQEDVGVSTQDLDDFRLGNSKRNIQTLHLQCANMVFCIFDALHRLDCDTKGLRPLVPVKDNQRDAIRDFIEDISKDKLALLASKCRSHVRALYYFEQYLFWRKTHLNNHATALQRIHVALDDPYEASGIEMVRTTPTTILDDMSNYEACGRFDKAFICCSTVLDSTQSDECGSIIEDALRCLSSHGDYQRLFEKSKQLIDDYSKYKRNVLPRIIEASWKLSKWDELSTYYANDQSKNMLDIAPVGQGLLLNSIHDHEGNISEKLKVVRHELMRPLSIAMVDGSAYFRGYQNLLVLHSVQDFAICGKILEDIRLNMQQLDENTVDDIRSEFDSSLNRIFDIWSKRNGLVQPSLRSLEPLLEWQRSICLSIAKQCPLMKYKIDLHVAELWLSSADSAREANSFDRAFFCITQARRWFGSEFHQLSLDLRVRYYIEQAKLDWDQGEQTKAIRGLKLTLERLKDHKLYQHLENRRKGYRNPDPFPQLNNLQPCNECSTFDKLERESFAQLKMLMTRYSEESASEIPETLFFMYEECVHLGVNQEETYFRLARYYDKLLTYYIENPSLCGEQAEEKHVLMDATQRFSQNLMSGDKDEVYTKLMEHSIIAFGNSLKYGATHLKESMPRMLNLWYDLGSRKTKTGTSRVLSSRIENTVRFVDELRNKILPPYYFMTAISIILSRVSHPHSGISKKTCEILESLLVNYPHQITWLMLALVNDRLAENQDRNKAARVILQSSKRKGPAIEKIVRDTMEFSRVIVELCYHHTPKDPTRNERERKKLTGKVNITEITQSVAKFKFSEAKVVAPIQETMRSIIPFDPSSTSPNKHSTFPDHSIPYVREFDSTVRIFNSLQQPRQVTLKCDQGRSVSIICKAGDDLRKDSRCIEFLNLLNSILRRDSQSNVRFLDIQTFLVLPLGNEAGIIEMVPNCDSLRNIMEPIYKEGKPNFSMHEQPPKKERGPHTANEFKEYFEKKLLPKTVPAVLPTWFLRKYMEPTSWYMARLAFTRSAAVISMGGYIIGLGDRHLDNILIDTKTGKIVHVDFNLLFHQGESLLVPEIVPFRLTHNLVAAFGPIGTEGNFRRVCEITMRVMRKEKDALLTTLKPFMHDPCIEWIKVRETRNRLDREDKHAENKSAKFRIEVTERKLKGYPRSKQFKPLTLIDSYSVEAQVENLIAEASDNYNLAQMYYGWCPHI